MSKTHQGSCHCGNVSFSFEHDEITKGLRCNCSICRRKGAVMSPFTLTKDEININTNEAELGLYQFDNKVAKHFFCKNCGIYTFNETLRMPGQYRVNLGCVEGIDTNTLAVDVFDGNSLPKT